MILLIDNYDSFTYNLFQGLAGHGAELDVCRNDDTTVDGLLAQQPSAVVISPGPGRPENAGVSLPLLRHLPATTPMLGVCLGHQCLVVSEGGKLETDPVPVHGKTSSVHHDGSGLFAGLPTPIQAGRYHSLRADAACIPATLQVSAWTSDGLVMAVRHRTRPWYGFQFHAESMLTPYGDRLLEAFVAVSRRSSRERRPLEP
ncbi:MAG: anthranilate synthase component II, partial [Acidimicrobiia bacterium]